MRARHAGLPLLVALATVLLPAVAMAGPWLLSPNEYYTEMRGNYFSSDRMWDPTGESTNLGSTATLERRSLTSYTEIGWKHWLSVSLEVPFQSRTLRSPSPHAHATETGLGDMTLGARFGLVQGSTAVAIDVLWQTPMGYHRDVTPALGDGMNDITARLSLGSSLPALETFYQVSGGYRYRIDDRKKKVGEMLGFDVVSTEDPPAEFVGSADVGVWASDGILISGHYRGFVALESATVRDRVQIFPAGVVTVFWPERSLHTAGAEARYRVDDLLDLFAGWSHAFKGENTMDVDDIYVGVAFRQTQLNRLQGFLGSRQAP